MTKVRPPVSIENTLFRVLGELGIERAAEVTGRSQDYLRALTDPDKREQLSVRDLLLLDRACRAAGDPTYPLYETVGLMLDAEDAERFARGIALGRHAETTARESGEAFSALVAAALASDDPKAIDEALRQGEEAHDAWTDTIAALREHQQRRVRAAEHPP